MPAVTFLPVGKQCEAKQGETLLEVALLNDVPLQHACGGFCSCTTCHVYVKENPHNLSPMDEMEQDRLKDAADEVKPESRLGCQAKVQGDVTVHIINLDL